MGGIGNHNKIKTENGIYAEFPFSLFTGYSAAVALCTYYMSYAHPSFHSTIMLMIIISRTNIGNTKTQSLLSPVGLSAIVTTQNAATKT